jgi:hypothetical protein
MSTDRDRLVLPIRLHKVEYYGPPPAPGEPIDCTVLVRGVRRHEVIVDLDLRRNGQPYAYADGWVDWRFHTSGHIFEAMRQPMLHLLADSQPEGFVLLKTEDWPASIRDFLARRYLSTEEIEAKGGLQELLRQVEWLCGRIAAKDAVRHWLQQEMGLRVFPGEIAIETRTFGEAARARSVRAGRAGVDRAQGGYRLRDGRRGRRPRDRRREDHRARGRIRVARVPPRRDRVVAARRSRRMGDPFLDREGSRGQGARHGTRRRPEIGSRRGGGRDRILVAGHRVATRRIGDYIVAWTSGER